MKYNLHFPLYLPDGWLNMRGIIDSGFPFIWIVGARGIGKTFGALEYLSSQDKKYMYLRRTDKQLEKVLKNPKLSPFVDINNKKGYTIEPFKDGETYNLYSTEKDEKGKPQPVGDYLGICASMSTFANLRGFSGFDIEYMFWDEFIPEKHERKIVDEGDAVFNAYETTNRNRELAQEGERKPITLIGAANAFDIANPIFMYYGIVAELEKAFIRDRKEIWYSEKRHILIIHPLNSPISQAKEETVLYQSLGKDSTFGRMALSNDFSYEDMSIIISKDLSGYKPIVSIGEITIYEHKNTGRMYVTTHKRGGCPTFRSSETDCMRFFTQYRYLWRDYMYNNMDFETYFCEVLFRKYCDVKK